MKVIDSYMDDIGYIVFVLEDNSEKKFPTYWVFSPWLGAQDHQELQTLLSQAINREIECIQCKTKEMRQFPPKDKKFICLKCDAINDLDRDLLTCMDTADITYYK